MPRARDHLRQQVADLQRRLRKAQERIDVLENQLHVIRDGGWQTLQEARRFAADALEYAGVKKPYRLPYLPGYPTDLVERALRVQFQQAQEWAKYWWTVSNGLYAAFMSTQAERDAAIEGQTRMGDAYTRLSFYTRALNRQSDAQTARAEATERERDGWRGNCDALMQDVERQRAKIATVKADAAEQRALAEELAQAVVGIGYQNTEEREHQEGWRCKLCHAWWPLNTKPRHEDDCLLAPAEAQKEDN